MKPHVSTTQRYLNYLEFKHNSRNILGFVIWSFPEWCNTTPAERILLLQGEERVISHCPRVKLPRRTLPVLP
jgi:hypothetical protein